MNKKLERLLEYDDIDHPLWYAVQGDGYTEWDEGSEDLVNAIEKLSRYKNGKISVIEYSKDNSKDSFCLDVIEYDELLDILYEMDDIPATLFFKREDIDFIDKLVNLYEGEQIDESVYDAYDGNATFERMDKAVYDLLSSDTSNFGNLRDYLDLIGGYEGPTLHDTLTGGLYNNDLLYMTAIASDLELPLPENASDYLTLETDDQCME